MSMVMQKSPVGAMVADCSDAKEVLDAIEAIHATGAKVHSITPYQPYVSLGAERNSGQKILVVGMNRAQFKDVI